MSVVENSKGVIGTSNIKKTWRGTMINNMLTRRKESDTYLATVSRHHWSQQITMKIDK